jgi:hypothetical protein
MEQEKLRGAEKLYRRAIAILEKAYAGRNQQIEVLFEALSLSLQMQGRIMEADKLRRQLPGMAFR